MAARSASASLPRQFIHELMARGCSLQRFDRALRLLLLALSASALLLTQASAANITAPRENLDRGGQSPDTSSYAPSDPVKCDIRLDGPIITGDADNFERIAGTLLRDHSGKTLYVCLNSGGGIVKEALKIAYYIRWLGSGPRVSPLLWKGFDSPIVTVVEDQKWCASACALIFMAGSALTRPVRFLHPRGRLLFHPSFIPVQALRELIERQKPDELAKQIADLYDLGLKDFRQVISTFEAVSIPGQDLQPPWVKPSLFLEAYSQDPSEWLCIDAIDQVGHWDIQLYGFAEPKEITKPMVYEACQNTFYWRRDRSARVPSDAAREGSDLPVFWTPLDEQIAGRNVWSAGFDARAKVFAKNNYSQCIVEMSGNAQSKIFYADFSGRRVTDIYDVPLTAFFAPDTSLPDIAKTGAEIAPSFGGVRNPPASQSGFREYPDDVMVGCNLRRLPAADVAACQQACRDAQGCQGYSFNKISRSCELKHILTAMRRDPLWTSGVPSLIDEKQVHRSRRLVVMRHPLPDPPGTRYARDLVGEQKEVLPGVSRESCQNKCETDSACVGYSFYGDRPPSERVSRCVLFSRIDNVVPGWADSAVKRQP